MIAVVLLLLDGLDVLRQERVSVKYANEHHLSIAALAHDPGTALTVIRNGVAAAVLVAVEMAGGALDELLGGTRVYFARRATVRVDAESELIRRALRNSRGDVALVAELLGVPLRQVQALAGVASAPDAIRRGVARGERR
jgi:hypothetical protein